MTDHYHSTYVMLVINSFITNPVPVFSVIMCKVLSVIKCCRHV